MSREPAVEPPVRYHRAWTRQRFLGRPREMSYRWPGRPQAVPVTAPMPRHRLALMSLGAAIAIGAVLGLALGIVVGVAIDIPLAPEVGLLLGGLLGWLWRRGRA
jgi:hypothetical protein